MHCVSVHVICDKKFLLLRRSAEYLKGTWQMVSGGIEASEKAYEAARREVIEETGLEPEQLYAADAVETFYMKSHDKIAHVPVFVAYVKAQEPLHLSEHDAAEWLSYEEAYKRLIFAEQKRVLTHIYENFVVEDPPLIHLIYEK